MREFARYSEITAISSVEPASSEAQARAFVARQRNRRIDGSGISAAVVNRGCGTQAVGYIGLSDVDLSRGRATLGYWLLPRARGRGTATAAARIFIAWAVEALELRQIDALIEPTNAASVALVERLSFASQGLRPDAYEIDGTTRDMLLFTLRLPTGP